MRSRGAWILAALLLALSNSTGCTLFRTLHVLQPDFDASQPLGLVVWRLDASGAPTKLASVLSFAGVSSDANSAEVLEYSVQGSTGELTGPLFAYVRRDSSRPGAAEIYLSFDPGSPGTFVAQAYNAAGISPISLSSVQTS